MNNNENKPLGVLFNKLAYKTTDELEDFIVKLNNKSQNETVLAITSALKYAQSKGIFTLEESEIISIVLRKLKTQ